jgi:hypothetical protein
VCPDDPKIATALKLVAFQPPREFGEIPDREFVPARGWVVKARGEVILVANQVAGQLDDRTRHPVSVCVSRLPENSKCFKIGRFYQLIKG